MVSSRVGTALRTARERSGWNREALAYHSGVSWSAIGQIESGRRKDVRLSSLVALAAALQVSVDYLVGGKATIAPNLLAHRAFVYRSDEEFIASAAPFLAEGVERSECVLAVATKWQTDRLRDALGDEAHDIRFEDSAEWYTSPVDTLNAYRSFVTEEFARGAHWLRILGEPVWAGRSKADMAAWTRYESFINLSFASAPATLMCPYDARSVPKNALADARRTHPEFAHAGESDTSAEYRSPEDFLLTGARAEMSR